MDSWAPCTVLITSRCELYVNDQSPTPRGADLINAFLVIIVINEILMQHRPQYKQPVSGFTHTPVQSNPPLPLFPLFLELLAQPLLAPFFLVENSLHGVFRRRVSDLRHLLVRQTALVLLTFAKEKPTGCCPGIDSALSLSQHTHFILHTSPVVVEVCCRRSHKLRQFRGQATDKRYTTMVLDRVRAQLSHLLLCGRVKRCIHDASTYDESMETMYSRIPDTLKNGQ